VNAVGDLVLALPNHYDEQSERAVLFLLMAHPDLFESEGRKILRDDFYLSGHKQAFDVMASLAARGMVLDPATIVAEARATQKPDVTEELVSGLTIIPEGEPTVDNLPTLAAQLRAESIKRMAQFGLVKGLVVAKDRNTTSEQLIESLELALSGIRNLESDDREATPIKKLLLNLCDEIEVRMTNPTGVRGVPTGFDKLDEMTGGFMPGELIIVSGWTGRGKSTLVTQWALHSARTGIPAIIYSLEMSDMGVADRIAAAVSGVEHYKIRQGRLTPDERLRLLESFGDYYDLPFWHDFVGGMTAKQICARAHADRAIKGVGMVIIDHIGKLRSEPGIRYGSREQEVSATSGEFDRLADELGIPVVLVSQMNRPFTPTGDVDEPTPSIHKLRESGRLEQDADVIVFTHRPGIKQAREARIVTGNNGLLEKAFILLGKCRSGESEVMLPIAFDGTHNRFLSLDNLPAGAAVHEASKAR
jgi:replicative DNA helicase